MEKGRANMNDYAIGSSYDEYSFPSVFDLSEEKSSVGFLELLGLQNMNNNFDLPDIGKECSDQVFNNHQQPATPNSSSISSTSSEAINDENTKTLHDQPHNIHKPLKQ